jgi:lysylphosphatidylglycerol synthetase-like protein (DUF2156 family)
MPKKTRPNGITVLAALEVLAGIAYLLGAVALMVAGAMIPLTQLPMFLSPLAGVFGFVLLILAVVSFLLAYGLFTGRKWAWFWSLVFAIIGILVVLVEAVGSLSSAITPIVLHLIVIYYLTRPYVKVFFGK